MTRPVAFDITRLLLASTRSRPRGIERIDVLHAGWLAEHWQGPCFGVLPGPLGPLTIDRSSLARIVRQVVDAWNEGSSAGADAQFARVRAWLLGESTTGDARLLPSSKPSVLKAVAKAAFTFIEPGRPSWWKTLATQRLPEGTVYVNTGHAGLALPGVAGWLARRPDIRVVAMIQDLISITHPEYFGKANQAYFGRVLASIRSHAAAVVVPSTQTRNDLLGHLRRHGKASLPVHVAHLPVSESVFSRRVAKDAHDPALRGVPYFAMVGTIEPRKNHLTMLHAWRELATSGKPVPKLVIAGARGWGTEQVNDMLDRCDAIRPHVLLAPELTSAGIAALVGNARALLMPTFVEGYGLPVAEALALGATVVASDVPVMREIGDGNAIFLGPTDGPAWIDAVSRLANAPAGSASTAPGGYAAPGTTAYLARILRIVEATADATDRPTARGR